MHPFQYAAVWSISSRDVKARNCESHLGRRKRR